MPGARLAWCASRAPRGGDEEDRIAAVVAIDLAGRGERDVGEAGFLEHLGQSLLSRLCAESNVIGVDFVELAPERDQTYLSTMNVNRVIRECLVGIAMRKKGITEKHYLSPLTVDDATD